MVRLTPSIRSSDTNGDLIAPAGRPDLQYQPLSALVNCNAGESVLLRFANLGFREASMSLTGIKMRVVGRDATPMKGRDGTDTSYETDTILIGAGESFDVIFTAPAHSGPGYDVYELYNRAYNRSDGDAGNAQKFVCTQPVHYLLSRSPINEKEFKNAYFKIQMDAVGIGGAVLITGDRPLCKEHSICISTIKSSHRHGLHQWPDF